MADQTAQPHTPEELLAAAEAAAEAAREAQARAEQALAEARSQVEQTQAQAPVKQQEPHPEERSPEGPLSTKAIETIVAGYTFEGQALHIGALVNGDAVPSAQIRIPFGMLNRHGLIAGATGTGKTKTLQGLAEQVSSGGVPVFAADIKGDLSGLAVAGTPNEKLLARTQAIGQDWQATAHPTEFFSLGGMGSGVPIRASVSGFGPVLLAKVLDLNETQESSLGLVFHYAQQHNLALITLADLQTLLTYLTSEQGKIELKAIGGLSTQTAGVILREIINLCAQGADAFFGSPQIEVSDFLRVSPDGKGIVNLLQLSGVQDKPGLFSTFLMWLLTELFRSLPEVGDQDKPKLVFFFDEAHLLFTGASKSFIETVTQTVRLIRSKGVGIFFITQTPKDVPSSVLSQLGSRVQHALRAHTPEDAKALKATVSTYPTSEYTLGEVLTQLGTGEAIVTVMSEKGAPTPVAWTRVRAPQGSMDPAPADALSSAIAASALSSKYAAAVSTAGAAELLGAKLDEQRKAEQAHAEAKQQAKAQTTPKTSKKRSTTRTQKTVLDEVMNSATTRTVIREATRELIRGIFTKK